MSGTVINLRQARKAKTRAEKEQTADENRRRHGRTKAEKAAEKSATDKSNQHLDGHKRDPEA
ncbi:MAG: DUF4169 family protein [Hyphomicrobiales bacterium]